MKNAVLRLTTNHRAVRCGRLQTMLYLEAGQRIIIVAGMPLGTPGATNMVRIAFVGGDSAGEVWHGAGNRPAPATYAPQRYPRTGVSPAWTSTTLPTWPTAPAWQSLPTAPACRACRTRRACRPG